MRMRMRRPPSGTAAVTDSVTSSIEAAMRERNSGVSLDSDRLLPPEQKQLPGPASQPHTFG